jgi:hypothetical protein
METRKVGVAARDRDCEALTEADARAESEPGGASVGVGGRDALPEVVLSDVLDAINDVEGNAVGATELDAVRVRKE